MDEQVMNEDDEDNNSAYDEDSCLVDTHNNLQD